MKILHVISTLDPEYGGPVFALESLARESARQGIGVEVATLDAPTAHWLGKQPFRVEALGPGRMSFGSAPYAYTPTLRPWLREKRQGFDAVVAHGIWQYQSLAVWKELRGSGTPYFVFPHGGLDPWFKQYYPLKHLKKWLYWPWAEYRVLRDAAAVMFTSEEERILARQSFWLYQCNERVLNFGCEPPPPAEGDIDAFHDVVPGLRNKRIALFLSRIHEKKGCDLLISAFARISRSAADLQLVIAGPDAAGMSAGLKALALKLGVAERVSWPGMLAGSAKWGALRAAEVFILPSHSENFGVVVAEALACGTPVLISNKVNIWKEVESAGAGLVEPDTQAGTDALFDRWLALTDPSRAAMRAAAQRCFHRCFHVKKVVERLRLLVDSVGTDMEVRGRAAIGSDDAVANPL